MAYRAAVPDTPVAGNIFSGVGTADGNMIHLSNGHAVALIGGTVYYSADHYTWSAVANIVGVNIPASLCRDSSDNLFVVHGEGSVFRVVALRRASNAYSWTRVADTAINLGGNTVSGVRIRWINTGWTAGRLLVLATSQGNYSAYASYDLAAFIAGTSQPQWVSVASASTIGSGAVGNYLNLHGNEFGSTRCMTTRPRGDGSSWIAEAQVIDVVGQGAPTVGASTIVNQPNFSGTGTNLLARVGVDKWVFIYATQPNETYYWARLVTPTGVGPAVRGPNVQFQMPSMSQSRGFSVQEDPVTAGRVSIVNTADGNSNNSVTIKRLGLVVTGETITWDSAPTSVDTFATPANNFGDTTEVYSVRTLVGSVGDLMYRSVATYNSGSGATTDRALTGAVAYNVAPTAATPTTPAAGSSVDRTQPITLAWVFNDPDTGDSQSKADIRYRLRSATDWTVILGATTTATSYALPANQAAGDYEWQVKTYDALGVEAPWSASSFFTAANPPGTPVITAPSSGGTVATSSYTVTWSSPTQDAYEVRRVADNAGSPVPGTVYATTGTVEDASSRARTVAFETNNRTEHVQVRVRYSGIWSQWATARVLVSYTPPATPVAVLVPVPEAGRLDVVVTNPTPTGSQPAVAYYEVLVDDGLGEGLTRRATNCTPNTTWSYILARARWDYAGNVRVVAVATNGTTATTTAT